MHAPSGVVPGPGTVHVGPTITTTSQVRLHVGTLKTAPDCIPPSIVPARMIPTMPKLPLLAKRLDHFTLICHDAKDVADFHVRALHFELDSIKPVNTGTVPDGEHDMLNYILRPPGNKDMVLVVTEGLNDATIFRKYAKAHGEGVHHVAFEVDNIDSTFAAIKGAGIQTTSEAITLDILSGLKQFFIAPCHAGFFIEMIERPQCHDENAKKDRDDATAPDPRELFASQNMAELAQSISRFVVEPEDADVAAETVDHDEKRKKTHACDLIADAMAGICVGEILAIEIAVGDLRSSAAFLVETLNFRFVRRTDEKVFVTLPGTRDAVHIVLSQAKATAQERKATVTFEAPNLTREKQKAMSDLQFCEATEAGIVLPGDQATYRVVLAPPSAISARNQTIRTHPSVFELEVDIKTDSSALLAFLARPENLALWTGHRHIHYSPEAKSWVETRMDTEFILDVKTEGSRVCFCWPQRGVEVAFHCTEIAPGYCSMSIGLPSTLSETALASMKHILSVELDLLKSILEQNTSDVIPDRVHQQIEAHHRSICGAEVAKQPLSDTAFQEFGFQGTVISSGPLWQQMSMDFALTVTSRPLAILLPASVADVRASVKAANAHRIPLAARGSRVSHSAGGQAQADGGLVLDMSRLSSVEFVAGRDDASSAPAIRVAAGTLWDEVIRQTLCRGWMPPVINDYQYLSVGGTISMGGVGFMSHQYGVQAAHVHELEVVTGTGSLLVCNEENHRDLFDCARGGLGQCGIITSVTIPLVKAPGSIRTFKLFYAATDAHSFAKDVKAFAESDRVEMIHAFLKPCTQKSMRSILGPDAFAAASDKFKTVIAKGESSRGLVFFVELGCYVWNTEADVSNIDAVLKLFLSRDAYLNGDGEFFSRECDFQTYITKDPPVVETNKAHGTIPHPSFATVIDEHNVVELLHCHLRSSERGDDNTNEILIMPMKSNAQLRLGYDVPMFPMPKLNVPTSRSKIEPLSFFLLFLGSVVPPDNDRDNNDNDCSFDSCGSSEIVLGRIRAHHRNLYKLSMALGGRRYSYDTITSEVKGEGSWKAHFGEATWERFVAAKRKYDPGHILCPGVGIWKN